jgi:hypothetical protein
MHTDAATMRLSFVEPEEPKLIREIGVGYIVERIVAGDGYSFRGPLMKQLLPEQIRILLSHAYRIYHHLCNFNPFTSQPRFVDQFRYEVEQIAKQEIEPGMFKNENIL